MSQCRPTIVAVVLVFGIACNSIVVNPPSPTVDLTVQLQMVALYENAAGQVTAQSFPLAGQTVGAFWAGTMYYSESDTAGIAVFKGVAANDQNRADLSIRRNGRYISVLGLAEAVAVVPVEVTTVAVGDIVSSTTQLQMEFTAWTTSANGQRSELFINHLHSLGLRPPANATASDDPYAQSSYVSGSGHIDCQDGVAPAAIVCDDPGGFASGPSGATLHAARGVIEIGFVERVVEAESRRFIETGLLFYDGEFETGQTSYVRLDPHPRREPDFELCDGDGNANLLLSGVGREFAIAAHGGIDVDLGLRSSKGLYLPILQGERWDPYLAQNTADGQLLRWRYPYSPTGLMSDFSYEYHVQATSVRVDAAAVAYLDRVAYRDAVEAEAICQQRAPTFVAAAEFDRPHALSPLNSSQRDILWSGATANVRLLEIIDSDGQSPIMVWLLAADIFRVDLDGPPLDGVNLAPGDYRLRLTAFAPGDQATLSDLVNPAAVGATFSQTHAFTVTP